MPISTYQRPFVKLTYICSCISLISSSKLAFYFRYETFRGDTNYWVCIPGYACMGCRAQWSCHSSSANKRRCIVRVFAKRCNKLGNMFTKVISGCIRWRLVRPTCSNPWTTKYSHERNERSLLFRENIPAMFVHCNRLVWSTAIFVHYLYTMLTFAIRKNWQFWHDIWNLLTEMTFTFYEISAQMLTSCFIIITAR